MPFALFLLVRLSLTAFCVLTSGYALLNCSPFAFEMFVKPQLFPPLTRFVAWHHVWFGAAYLASLATIYPELSGRPLRGGRTAAGAVRLAAVSYAVSFGVVAACLLLFPLLPGLWNDRRALPLAVAALVPVAWLGFIDHLSPCRAVPAGSCDRHVTAGERRLLLTCTGTAVYLWGTQVVAAMLSGRRVDGVAAWLLSAAWTLTLTAATFAGLFALFSLIAATAARSRAPRQCEHVLLAGLTAVAVAEFLRRTVFPTLSLHPTDSAIAAAAFGGAAAVTWSGLALRRPGAASPRIRSSSELLLMPVLGNVQATVVEGDSRGIGWRVFVRLIGLAAVSFLAFSYVERMDWNFVAQRTLVILHTVIAFGLLLRATAGVRESEDRPRRLSLVPVAALGMLLVLPAGASRLAAWTGEGSLDPSLAFERNLAAEVPFRMMSDALVARSGFEDPGYHRFLQQQADFAGTTVRVPDVEFSRVRKAVGAGERPDVYLFVIDSLRRDYLSPYNPDVSFTPSIDAFARENFAFRNAFTRHGGTELAMPSIWAGGAVVRKVRAGGFARMNALEKLVNAEGYRVAINDFTVAAHLDPATPVTTIDDGVPSVDTDLCRNVESLERYLERTSTDGRPVFGYFAPMNVHILNTRRRDQVSLDGAYPGFYAPYASRLKRLDACFGRFVSYLKERGRYDNSVIVLTSDHGDSLGENGYWGHAMWLFPEDVRLPLIVRVPERVREHVTTDLSRIAFATDIAPTLYAILGHAVERPGPMFGEPLFARRDGAVSDRRRQSFLLTSSYGATYGLVRRNGRSLYVSDLVEWRESAYDLSRGAAGVPAVVDSAVRRANQRLIREQVEQLADFYGRNR